MTDKYIFNRDLKSVTRLNYQHWVVRKICRYLVHPDIPKTGSNLKVADVGAGTGIWSFEASDYFPSDTTFTLFDISNDQYPPAHFNTTKAEYEVHDAFQPFPERFHGQFDVVHVRFLLTVLDPKNIEVFTANISQILKPGGYIQWLEYDMYATRTVHHSSGDVKTPALDQLVGSMKKPHPAADYSWVADLESVLQRHGLGSVKRQRIEWQKQNYPLIMHVHFLTLEDFCAKAVHTGEYEKAAMLRKLLNDVHSEINEGSALVTDFIVTVAQKS